MNVKSLIKNLYNDRSRIEKVGSEANIFVKTYYEPKFVAKRLVNIINGSVPKEAYFQKRLQIILQVGVAADKNCWRTYVGS